MHDGVPVSGLAMNTSVVVAAAGGARSNASGRASAMLPSTPPRYQSTRPPGPAMRASRAS
ncbi:hypothetical protein D3C83_232040 [compost metagenome]